jgi:hypothetical protein
MAGDLVVEDMVVRVEAQVDMAVVAVVAVVAVDMEVEVSL